ncbi:unnamed protein product [Owenia fusiformis]|uniref:Intraflagellar transport protein 43 homolog n=1 Tax=Owenia fusiformis TaxID=6347 RepID=A0A8S4PF99_OWEFU|nr:unnamed protein product [Owenia fusiformis]
MDEDDLEFDQPKKKGSAKQGRRSRRPPVDDDVGVAEDDMIAETTPTTSNSSKNRSDGPPKPQRRTGGWGDDSSKRRRGGDVEEDERLKPTAISDDDNSDNDIPVIPDLDDVQEEDMSNQVAQAPTMLVNRVSTFRELDNDLLKHAAFLTLDNEIDLKILAQCLSSEADVTEEDKPWDWDRLFTEVSYDLTTEWEANEATEEQDTKS